MTVAAAAVVDISPLLRVFYLAFIVLPLVWAELLPEEMAAIRSSTVTQPSVVVVVVIIRPVKTGDVVVVERGLVVPAPDHKEAMAEMGPLMLVEVEVVPRLLEETLPLIKLVVTAVMDPRGMAKPILVEVVVADLTVVDQEEQVEVAQGLEIMLQGLREPMDLVVVVEAKAKAVELPVVAVPGVFGSSISQRT